MLDDGTLEITKYNGTDTAVTLPDTLDGYTVISIGKRAFFSNYDLTDVTIPDSMTVLRMVAGLK